MRQLRFVAYYRLRKTFLLGIKHKHTVCWKGHGYCTFPSRITISRKIQVKLSINLQYLMKNSSTLNRIDREAIKVPYSLYRTVTTLQHMLLLPETKGSSVHVLLITACVSDYVHRLHMHKLCCLRTKETHAKLLAKSTARDS